MFTASFGQGGFRTTRVRQTNRGQGQANANAGTQSPRSMLIQLLPLILLFAFSFLSALPNLFAEPSTPDPQFSFQSSRHFSTERQTSGLGVRYHVNSVEFTRHPLIAADLAAAAENSKDSKSKSKRGTSALDRFEGTVERTYTHQLYGECQRGVERRERRKEAEIGFLGIGTDWDKVREIDKETVESCEMLKKLGVRF